MLQITKSKITKANLKTKTSTEQHSQRCNTSQQTDWASLHRRWVSQHNSSSSPKHIASGFGHRRWLTGSDRRSLIGHVAHSVAYRLAWPWFLQCRPLALGLPAPVLLQPQPQCISQLLSLFRSDSLLVSLSLSEKWKWKWNEMNGSLSLSLSLSLYSLRL